MPSLGPKDIPMAPVDRAGLVARKGATTVSLCLPARDEAATVGTIVAAAVAELVDAVPLLDEVLVVDDRSSDATAEAAAAAGARVVAADDVLPELGPGTGKGEALWKSLAASSGDVVVWCDADLREFDADFVTRLVAPLLLDDGIDYVKAYYHRPVDGDPTGGGRVTELVARPAIALLLPHLAAFRQPLAGEYAGRRRVLERVPFVQGYGVELALLADLAEEVGLHRMAQVDLGRRLHRNRPLAELSPQALAVLGTALDRADRGRRAGADGPARGDGLVEGERPPLVDVPAYRSARRAAS